MLRLLDTLFGCPHRQLTFPITVKPPRSGGADLAETYVVCLECGKEFTYDWQNMEVVFFPKRLPKLPETSAAQERRA